MTSLLTTQDFKRMEKHHRVHFINSLSDNKSANLVATIDSVGNSNVCIAPEFNQTSLIEHYTDLTAPYVPQSKIKMGGEFRKKSILN